MQHGNVLPGNLLSFMTFRLDVPACLVTCMLQVVPSRCD